jgi:hypothetical protein
MHKRTLGAASVIALGTLFYVAVASGQYAGAPPKGFTVSKRAVKTSSPAIEPGLQPKAIEILKATSARLAAAKSMAYGRGV